MSQNLESTDAFTIAADHHNQAALEYGLLNNPKDAAMYHQKLQLSIIMLQFSMKR